MAITLSDLLAATGGELHGPTVVESWVDFCHDSRLAQPGQLFVALRTATGDGHDHIREAIASGCTGVICQHPIAEHPAVTTLLVPDSGDALRAWATQVLRRQQLLVIAITGSSGKTTTKDLTASILEKRYGDTVFRTKSSYNDRLGIPLALGELRPQHRLAVIEVGTDAFGEIAELSSLIQPTIAAITVINDAHLDTFGSLAAIAREKAALVRSLPPYGIAILNLDDDRVAELAHSRAHPSLTHGNGDGIVRSGKSLDTPYSLQFDSRQLAALQAGLRAPYPWLSPVVQTLNQGTIPLASQLFGDHQQVAIRTAVAIGLLCGVSPRDIAAAISEFEPLPGRMRILAGKYGTTLIDDTYSANPAATVAALAALAGEEAPRIAVIGTHDDVGHDLATRLAGLGPTIAACADWLVAVGAQAPALRQVAATAGMAGSRIFQADTPAAAGEIVMDLLKQSHTPGTVLLKGSREARLERTVATLLEEPTASAKLLARQDPGWQHVHVRNNLRPTWVEIDTVALADNVLAIRRHLQPQVKLIAILKADAYGHGGATVARIAARAGAEILAVACIPEAQALRQAGIKTPILILGYTPPWQARTALALDLQLTIYDLDVAAALAEAAAATGRRAFVHVKVDTGMGRLGLLPSEVVEFLQRMQSFSSIQVQGLFTHMANADAPTHSFTDLQLERFNALLERLDHLDLRPPLIHAANTATILTRPDAQYDAVRLGIGLYGLAPSAESPLPPGFRPALSWKTTIAQVKILPPGSPVGYGLTYTTPAQCTVAVIPVGYADGFRRAPRHWANVLVRGERAPLIGRVSMDQATIDVSHIPGVRAGDEVVLIGRQGEQIITADEVAAALGTINYEVISAILARVPRLPA